MTIDEFLLHALVGKWIIADLTEPRGFIQGLIVNAHYFEGYTGPSIEVREENGRRTWVDVSIIKKPVVFVDRPDESISTP